jgi:hypothetical protein
VPLMARCTYPHASRARASRRALIAAATLAGCALVPAALPSALAAKSTTTSATAPPVELLTPAQQRRAERAAEAEHAPPALAPPPAPAVPLSGPVAHAHHAPSGAGSASPPVLAPAPPSAGAHHSASAGAMPGTRAHGRATPAKGGATGASGADDSSAGAVVPGLAATGDPTQGVEALAKTKKGSGGKTKKQKEKAEKGKGKGGKGKETEGKESEGESPGEKEAVGQSGSATKSKSEVPAAEAQPAVDPTALAAAVSAPGPSPASGTGEALVASALPAVKAPRSATAAHAKPRGHRTKHAGAGVVAAAGSLATAAALPAASAASGATPPSSAPHATAKHKLRSTQPALVKTITKIVNVVPAPMRLLIGALIALALALGLRSLLTSIRTRRLVRQRGELLEDVGLLQAALLPAPPSRLGPVGTSVAYRPADGPGAGGDFYDAFALADGRLAVIVGDVSGHGREALPHTALVRFTVRAYMEAGQSPAAALRTAGVVLERQLGGSFATVIAAIYHPRERTLTYASAGHPPPVVLGEPSTDGTFERAATVTSCSAPPIGADSRTGTRETVVSVPGAARLCFYTDGVTEARVGGELFGSERLTRTLAALARGVGAASLLDDVAAQSDARPDDMAACLLEVHGGSGAPAVVSERVELDEESLRRGRLASFLSDSGVEQAQATRVIDAAAAALARAGAAVLELRFEDGTPIASLRPDNVIPAKPLAVARAS